MRVVSFVVPLLVACAPSPEDVSFDGAPPAAEVGQVSVAEVPPEVADPAVRVTDVVLERAELAEAVFSGTIVDIAYRDSAPNSEGATWPHTYVTYRVERAWKGVEEGGTLTLRFIGGASADGLHLLQVSELPSFVVGQTDLLFVRDNERSACPLVDCAAGRIRYVRGGAYTDEGRALALDADGEVVFGGSPRWPEFSEVVVGGRTLPKRRGGVDPVPGAEGALRADLEGWLTGQVADDLGVRVASASPDRSFVIEP